jgi:hypothetical protein
MLSLFRKIQNNNTIVQKIVIDDFSSTYNNVGNRNNTHSRNSQPYLCNTFKNSSSYHQNPFCHQISNTSIKSISAITQNTLDIQEKLMDILKENFSTIRNENQDLMILFLLKKFTMLETRFLILIYHTLKVMDL